MNAPHNSKAHSRSGLGMALVTLLFLACGICYAQKTKAASSTPAPAKPAPAPAPAAKAAPAAARPGGTPAPAQKAGGTSPVQGRGNTPGVQTRKPVGPVGVPGKNPPVPVAKTPIPVRPLTPPGRPEPPKPLTIDPVPAGGNPTGPRPNINRPDGSSAHFGTNGRPTVVHTASGATIVHSPNGARRVEVAQPGGRRIVTNAAGHGYVERPMIVHGQNIVQRTYYVRGAPYTRVYRPLTYGRVSYNVYMPMRYYSPRFYTWGYTPWRSPVYFSFGYAATPWFGFYTGYFAPYPYYAGPNYWLTDYLVAASLQDAYQQGLDAGAAAQPYYNSSGQVPLSPQVKDQIAAEVQRQLQQSAVESQSAQQGALPAANGAPPILADNNPHVFVVSTSLIANTGNDECALTEGDVLQLNPAPSPNATFANVQVLASKGQDCQAGKLVPVQLADLQDMQNHMRENLDQGLADLQAKQGQGGLPAIDASLRTTTPSPIAADAPPPEVNVAGELQQQAQNADQQERQMLGGPSDNPTPIEGPPTVELGDTISQVEAKLGQPLRKANLGQKITYFYKDMKVIFMDGKVNDVQ